MDSLPARLAQATPVAVEGVWQRHVAAKDLVGALHGRVGTGRWGTERGFPVLYLGQPRDAVVDDDDGHLSDPIADDPAPQISPRALVTCEVAVKALLDLRSA